MAAKYRFTKKLKPGAVLDDRFEVITEIGKGRTARVYRALDRQSGGEVAVKTILHGEVPVAEQVGRYEREAEVCRSLQNPCTARLLHFGVNPVSGLPYLAFELVRGMPLNRLLEVRKTLTLPETAHVLSGLLGALDEAHGHGIVHRDVKPDDILLAPGEAALTTPEAEGRLAQRLGIPPANDPVWEDVRGMQVRMIDFGLAKILGPDGDQQALTHIGALAGTPQYASPEQVRSDPNLDRRADIYGVGMLLHRLLVGRPPFEARNLAELGFKHLNEPLPALPEPYTNAPVAAVFRKAGAKDREERFYSAAEMAWELRHAVDPASAGPKPSFTQAPAEAPEAGPGLFGKVKRWFGRA